MDAFSNPNIEEIIFCASTQVGKTEAMLNMLGFAIDQDPGPALWVDMDELEAKDLCSERIIPMTRITPAVNKHLTDNLDDVTKKGIKFDRMKLKIGWATSPRKLASRAIRYLFFNETNKYPPFSGREADPIKLGKERTRTFPYNRKIVCCSTPTLPEGYITREYELTDRRKFYVPCPHCGFYQLLLWPQIKFPKDERNSQIIRSKNLAYYECIHCHGKINDEMKPKMLSLGRWIPDEFDANDTHDIEFPVFSKIGFWINSLYSPWLTFSEIAAEWLDSQGHNELLMNFINSWLAEPWSETMQKTQPDEIRALIQPYPAKLVPNEALVLIAAVDVQKDYFIVTVRAYGYNSRSWLIWACRMESWSDIELFLLKTAYPKENKEEIPIRLINLDTGYRTDEVYDFCATHRDICRPIKGRDNLGGMPFKITTIERLPKTGKMIPGGLKLWILDTNFFKDKVARLIKNAREGGPGGWALYQETPNDYILQMCSEHKVPIRDKKKRQIREEWAPVSSHAPTHFWDCEVYNVAGAEMLRIFYLRKDEITVPQPTVENPSPDKKNTWITHKKNWIKNND